MRSRGYGREQYAIQLGLLSDHYLERVASLTPNATRARASYKEFVAVFKDATMNALYGAGESVKGVKKLASTTTDQVFFAIPPCRIVDTRNVGGPIAATFARNFYYFAPTAGFSWSAQGGAADTALNACPGTVPTNLGGTLGNVAPSAAMATVTVSVRPQRAIG